MKYNIMVVLNSSYFNFGKVFINSLYDNVNVDNIDTIFIVNTGLSKFDKEYFRKFDKVYIHDTGLESDYNDGGSFGTGWQKSVGCKTIVLKSLLEQTNLPIVMIDGDCIFVKDFSYIIDNSYDIQSCKRISNVPYLASFVIAHNSKNCLKFLDKWIELISQKPIDVPRESPSLGETVLELKDEVKVGDIPRIKVSTHIENEFCEDTCIIHLKGSTVSKDIEEREKKSLTGNPNFSDLIKRYIV